MKNGYHNGAPLKKLTMYKFHLYVVPRRFEMEALIAIVMVIFMVLVAAYAALILWNILPYLIVFIIVIVVLKALFKSGSGKK